MTRVRLQRVRVRPGLQRAGRFITELVILGCVLVSTSQGQVSRPGATHLDAREVVVSVYPDSLDGVFFQAKIHHKKKWLEFVTRFDPRSVSRWLESIDRMTPPVAAEKQRQSSVLAGLGGKEGIVLVVPQKGDHYWLLQRLEDEPLLIRADRRFNDTLLVALRAAIPFSAMDSAAFASGLVPPLAVEPDSCGIRVIHIPVPQYPSRMVLEQIEGRVEVRYIVNADGRADSTSIEPLWATHPEFIQPVIQALKEGRFRPARSNGKPIRRQVYQGVSFRREGSQGMWH
jgi:TonB family protein